MLNWCRLIIWFHDHLPFMIIYCPTVTVTWRMLKLCDNGSNIDYLYETSSVLRKATETKISGLTYWLRFGFLKTILKFGFRTSLAFVVFAVCTCVLWWKSDELWLLHRHAPVVYNLLHLRCWPSATHSPDDNGYNVMGNMRVCTSCSKIKKKNKYVVIS